MREIMIRRIMLKLEGVPQLEKQRIATDIFDDFEAAYPEIRKPIPTNYE